MHDYICGKLPNSFHGNYPMNRDIQQTHQTRQSGLLYVPRYASKYAQRSPHYQMLTLCGINGLLMPRTNIEKPI